MLRRELTHKDDELNDLKKRVQQLLQKEDSGAHYTAFFERQTQDLMYTKKIISEYEKRENECTKKWNELLNENILNAEKIMGLKSQLQRQRDMFQVVITENERRLADANERLIQQFHPDKREAAEYLVSQIELLKEERRALLEDNDELNLKVHDLYAENESLKKDLEIIDFLKGGDHMSREDKMMRRIEELEDLLIEMKQKSGVQRIIQLESQVTNLNIEIGQKQKEVEAANTRIKEFGKKEVGYLDESEAINFFSELIKEKDCEIQKLSRKLNTVSTLEKSKDEERLRLEEMVKQKNEQYDDLKNRKVQFSEYMKDKEMRHTQQDSRARWFVDEDSQVLS